MTSTVPSADGAVSPKPPSHLPLPVLVVIGALTAVPPLVTDFFLPGLPSMARSLGASDAMGQLTISLCLLGLALGQLVVGPLSDRVGRMRPLRWGVALLAVTSFLCAVSGSLWILLVARLLQGLAGSAAVVIARAIVRDVYDGPRVAKVFSELMLVMGLAPVVGPIVGGQLLRFTDWRGIFVVLGILTSLLLAASWALLHETRTPDADPVAVRTGRALWSLVRDPHFAAYMVVTGLGGVILFTYIAMSPFVLQDGYGLSAVGYSVVFGANAVGLVIGSQLNARLVMRVGPAPMLRYGLILMMVASALVMVAQWRDAPKMLVLVPLWFVLVGFGTVMGNAAALALEPHREIAGAASALLGAANFILGGLVPPLVSAGGTGGPVMGLTMTIAAAVALGALLLVLRTTRQATGPATGPATRRTGRSGARR